MKRGMSWEWFCLLSILGHPSFLQNKTFHVQCDKDHSTDHDAVTGKDCIPCRKGLIGNYAPAGQTGTLTAAFVAGFVDGGAIFKALGGSLIYD
jgi:hypothetical protein